MHLHHSRFRTTTLSLLLAAGTAAMAVPVTSTQAQMAARTWLLRTPAPLQANLSPDIASVEPYVDADGRTLFHEVRLASGGFVIVAPDDLIEPIIAFSDAGVLQRTGESHLFMMLERDLRHRLDLIPTGKGPYTDPAANLAQAKWQDLNGMITANAAVASISDVRVAPLVGSTWSQESFSGNYLYNYYTPSHIVCGCVATAMAQLMRYHQFPTTGIGASTYAVTVNGAARNLATRGGDGAGGAYNWALMPLTPTSGISTSERQQIGALCYDAGLAVHMAYATDGSGAYMGDASTALSSVFHYANTVYGNTGSELTGHGLVEMVQPNLDAGYPVLFGITGDGGHAIVCDGYGFTGTTPYYHLNMGWAGSDNAWYTLPDIGTWANFYMIDDCIYNAFPSGSGEILSGRVTDGSGAPVAGVLVTDGNVSSTTNAKGIYALKGIAAGVRAISATKAGLTFPGAVRLVGTSSNSATVGNVWGVDLVQGAGATPTISPAPLSQDVKLGGNVTFLAGATGQGTLHFAWTKNGSAVGTDSPTYSLSGATEADNQAAVVVHVSGSLGTGESAPAILNVVRLFNGNFELGNSGWSLYNPDVVLGPSDYTQVTPHGGSKWLCIGDWSTPRTDFAMQDITLPATGSMSLSFWMGIANLASTPATAANVFNVKVLNTSNVVLATLDTQNNLDAAVDGSGKVIWKSYGPYDLSAWKGQTIRLRIESTQAGGDKTGTIFAVDDISLALGANATPTAVLATTPLTMATGGHTTFTAQVNGFASDNSVDWTVGAGGGSFSPARTAGDGTTATTYTAGATAGSYTVTATPVEVPGTAASRSVTLVDPSAVTVNLVPSATLVAVGDPVTLTASVTTLTDASVDWQANGGSYSAKNATTATWSSATAGTFTLTAASNGAPTRTATTQVQVVDLGAISLAVTPAAVTLRPGAVMGFTATGDLGMGVNWSLTPTATHADSGLTTSVTVPATVPLDTVTYTVTATHKVSASKTAAAVITVKGVDLVHDGSVDVRDLLGFAAEYGKGASSPANFKGSGTVDDTDLATLLDQIK